MIEYISCNLFFKPLNNYLTPFFLYSTSAFKESPIEKKKILIVDDNAVNRLVLKSFLHKNFICEFAVDGEDAVKKHIAFQSDYILMDIEMPKKDGIQASKEIREMEKKIGLPRVPIIAVTTIQSLVIAEIDYWTDKPRTQEAILKIIENVTKSFDDKFKKNDAEKVPFHSLVMPMKAY